MTQTDLQDTPPANQWKTERSDEVELPISLEESSLIRHPFIPSDERENGEIQYHSSIQSLQEKVREQPGLREKLQTQHAILTEFLSPGQKLKEIQQLLKDFPAETRCTDLSHSPIDAAFSFLRLLSSRIQEFRDINGNDASGQLAQASKLVTEQRAEAITSFVKLAKEAQKESPMSTIDRNTEEIATTMLSSSFSHSVFQRRLAQLTIDGNGYSEGYYRFVDPATTKYFILYSWHPTINAAWGSHSMSHCALTILKYIKSRMDE